MLNILGIEGPKISASIKPTRAPVFATETARLAAIVDFPTPPFPDAMAIIFFTLLIEAFCFKGDTLGATSATTITSTATSSPNFCWITFVAVFLIDAANGSFALVSLRVNDTLPPSTLRPCTIPMLTISFPVSGCNTFTSASLTESTDNAIILI
jgi:hypothetical protein